MKRIVCDTGPLLHLREIDSLPILQRAGRIHIPAAVQAELLSLDASWQGALEDWVLVSPLASHSSEEALRWIQAGLLDPGEAEALALALQVEADWLLTDDAAARIVAARHGMEVHDSLGVILWAAAFGHLDKVEAEAALEALSRSSLWISSRVLTEARAALRQIF
ncbi:MAG TPA: DUF3368 domain-containing protein [Thermoanaerobaculia bacterium]|nr:DUF3368 domain-containing protein [Thermoanaerobaculia bacterium]